mgnify:FL=1
MGIIMVRKTILLRPNNLRSCVRVVIFLWMIGSLLKISGNMDLNVEPVS